MDNKNETKKESAEVKYIWLGVLIAIVVVIWIASYFLLKDCEDRGSLGDMFGGVNALFSGLAFAGVIFAIFLQNRELGLQWKELITQNDTMSKQRFESTFFHLLSLHHEIIDHMSSDSFGNHFEKREVIDKMVSDLKSWLKVYEKDSGNILIPDPDLPIDPNLRSIELNTKLAVNVYTRFYENNKNLLSHYFRNLYHVFRFVHTSGAITKNEKKFYTSIARAQLSHDELFLIMYNSLADNLGYPNFLYLIREYNILKTLNFNDVPFGGEEVFKEKLKNVHDPF